MRSQGFKLVGLCSQSSPRAGQEVTGGKAVVMSGDVYGCCVPVPGAALEHCNRVKKVKVYLPLWTA